MRYKRTAGRSRLSRRLLRLIWWGRLLFAVAWMSFAPLLDPLDIFLASEVIAVGRFGEPAPLAGGFAGSAALRYGTINLVMAVAVIRTEELIAKTALTTV